MAYWNDALRRELYSRGVSVCLVEPGPIKTEFTKALGSLVTAEKQVHPILDNGAPWMTADVVDVARRVARLLDSPRRRLSVLRRFVWLFRFLGVIARLCPPLGDRVVVAMQRENQAPIDSK
jgi:short-subunit dehydrogenase